MSTTQDLTGSGMTPALASRLGNNPVSLAGNGTTQTSAAALSGGAVMLITPASSNTAFVLSSSTSTGRPIWVWNQSATLSALVYPPSGALINGAAVNAAIEIPPLSGAVFQLQTGSGIAAETWGAILSGADAGLGSAIPQIVYNAVSTAPTSNNLALTGANITGGSVLVALNLTAALGAGATATLPIVTALVTAMQAAGLNPAAGSSYELDIYNSSSGNFAWTTTTSTGWTLSGTAQTIAQNTVRKYALTLTSLAAATLQSLGEFTVTAAP